MPMPTTAPAPTTAPPPAPAPAPARAEPTVHPDPTVNVGATIEVDTDAEAERARRITLTPADLDRQPLLSPQRVPVIAFKAGRRARGVWVVTTPMVVSRCWVRPDGGEAWLATLRRPVRIERPVRLTLRLWLTAPRAVPPTP